MRKTFTLSDLFIKKQKKLIPATHSKLCKLFLGKFRERIKMNLEGVSGDGSLLLSVLPINERDILKFN
jgi:hypothetical protein